MLGKSKEARAVGEQTDRQMHEEMNRLTDGRADRSIQEGWPPGIATGSACGSNGRGKAAGRAEVGPGRSGKHARPRRQTASLTLRSAGCRTDPRERQNSLGTRAPEVRAGAPL